MLPLFLKLFSSSSLCIPSAVHETKLFSLIVSTKNISDCFWYSISCIIESLRNETIILTAHFLRYFTTLHSNSLIWGTVLQKILEHASLYECNDSAKQLCHNENLGFAPLLRSWKLSCSRIFEEQYAMGSQELRIIKA